MFIKFLQTINIMIQGEMTAKDAGTVGIILAIGISGFALLVGMAILMKAMD